MDPILLASDDERLVFYDWLSRYSESDHFDELNAAEQRVLWDLEATLEKSLTEIVEADYRASVDAASNRLTTTDEASH